MTQPPHPLSALETAPLRPRHDGWTPARQQLFLQALAETASVSLAARRAGMSRTSAYRLHRHPDAEDFRALWDLALAQALALVPQVALERVLNGEEEQIERDGILVAVRRKPAHVKLLIHMLERADARCRSAEQQLAALRQFRHISETMPDSSDWLPSADAEHAARDAQYLPMTTIIAVPDDDFIEIGHPKAGKPKIKILQNQR